MNENRPSKKQRELLSFIEGFIKGNGYGPSYREIMRALDYKSVSTVAVHVDGLIMRGLLRKKDNSARSLEVVTGVSIAPENSHITWLKNEIKKCENDKEAETLNAALEILDQKGD
jgi:repressor LexA